MSRAVNIAPAVMAGALNYLCQSGISFHRRVFCNPFRLQHGGNGFLVGLIQRNVKRNPALVEQLADKDIERCMVGNTLMHREFTSSYTAKFVIEKDRMYVENANRAFKEGYITMDNLEPNPKNPIIASFFRNIGYADQLGSGVRNLFKYTKFYSGKEPEFIYRGRCFQDYCAVG